MNTYIPEQSNANLRLLCRDEETRLLKTKTKESMDKYICTVCEYIYDPELGDPENGIAPGTSFEDLPDDWVCPLCGVGKEDFEITH